MNSGDRRQQVEDLCYAALQQDPAARAAFVAAACEGDEGLRREVEALLAHARTSEDFLTTPLSELAAHALADQGGVSLLGASLGVYRIHERIGSGGMGDVYRARDTRLGRDVAVKVLPPAFISDADRLARFGREAHLLATLNHPNIAAIYGLEESTGTQALVLELIEGPTLAELIAARTTREAETLRPRPRHGEAAPARGGGTPRGLGIKEALHIAKQIADALEAAHEKGIIHRDLKPANIKIASRGVVKLLDFGLARVWEGAPQSDVSASPRLTATDLGGRTVLGTPAYMSPEQARGQALDRRTDIWSFGCVLFEMLTGRRAFDGEGVSDTLAAVLRGEPDWAALPAATPPAIQRLLHRCLEKDRHRRIGDIAAALVLIEEAPSLTTPTSSIEVGAVEQQVPAAVVATRRERTSLARRRVVLIGAAALVLGSVVVGALWLAIRPAQLHVARLAIISPGTAALAIQGADRDVAVTPDGTRVVYVGNGRTQLFVRALDQLEPSPIATSIASLGGVFAAPNGQWVGFIESTYIMKKVPLTGGPAVTLGPMDGLSRGATWLPDETIVFATDNATTGLQRLSAAGETVTVLTHPDGLQGEADHLWPERLPGGRAVLFTITSTSGGLETAQVAVLDLMSGRQTSVLQGGHHAHYVASGHLVYVAGGTLRAVAFDVDRLAVRGAPVPVVPRLVTTTFGAGNYAVAATGTLVYVDAPDGGLGAATTLVWVDRQGREELVGSPRRAYSLPRISPDGTSIVVSSQDQELDLWRWDLPSGPLIRLTSDPGWDSWPVWAPDGKRLVFSSHRVGANFNLFWQTADGTGAAERLTESSNAQSPHSITPDGTQVVFHEVTLTHGRDLRLLTLGPARPSASQRAHGHSEKSRGGATSSERGELVEPRRVTHLLESRFDEENAVLSPDGRWLAYQSNNSGQLEVWVRPFPAVGDGQWQVSAAGGTRPLWARSGRELFYVAPDRSLMVAAVQADPGVWRAGPAAKLLDGRYVVATGHQGRNYDVSPDGQRFLMIKEDSADSTVAQPQIIVVQHFDEELKRLVPKN